jgi:NADPH:quinone reductase-like Zn-dependent oxidoreductase
MFKALVLSRNDDEVTAAVEALDEERLPAGDVTVAVEHSTLNYKDGLIIRNQAPLVRSYPHGSGASGSCRCPTAGRLGTPWRSAPPASPPCSR